MLLLLLLLAIWGGGRGLAVHSGVCLLFINEVRAIFNVSVGSGARISLAEKKTDRTNEHRATIIKTVHATVTGSKEPSSL